jgi:hypothetical protein
LMSRKIVGLMFPWKLDIDFDWPTSEPVKWRLAVLTVIWTC